MAHQITGREEDTSQPPEDDVSHICETCANYYDVVQHCDQSNVCDVGVCLLHDWEGKSFVDVVEPGYTCHEWEGVD